MLKQARPQVAQGRPGALLESRLGDRRIVLIVACVLLFASGASLTVRTIVGQRVTVAGTVRDARTSKPVSGALIKTGEDEIKADGKGRFRLADVKRGTELRITAANYRDARAAATPDPLGVSLRPIPITGTITSGFTGKGVSATVSGQKTEADGTYTLYGFGPGDTVEASAFGHNTVSIKVDAARHANAKLGLGRVDPNAILKPIDGFGYVNAPPELVDEMRYEMSAGDPLFANAITGVAVKSIVEGGESTALAIVVALDPSFAALPGTRDGFFEGIVEGSSSQSKVKIGDVETQRAEGDGLTGYAWQRYAAFAFVIGEDGKAVEAIVRSLVLGDTVSAA